MIKFKIRSLEIKDLSEYKKYMHPSMEHHDFNGPYFARRNEKELEAYIKAIEKRILRGEEGIIGKRVVVNAETDELIGMVNWYWKSEETNWMEIGIVIFNHHYWNKGLGVRILSQWIDIIFSENPDLVRLGLTTWSGNVGMMRVAEKLGFLKEAVYRKARIVDGEYYDSVSYGILKEEWRG